jgi:hypothetical protein
MTGPAERSDGDYGYDLAHEATAGGRPPAAPPAPAEPPARAAGGDPADPAGDPGREPRDPGGDLGYDEVHRA